MKIAIDARFLTHPQRGGFKTYTENLIHALSQIDDENRYLIYLDRQPSNCNLPDKANFTYKIIPSYIAFIGTAMREQITLRRQIAKDKPDIVHFLCNTAPVNLHSKFILSLLDVIQITSPQTFPTAKGFAYYKPWAITAYSKWTILNTISFANRIITLSHYEKSQIIEHLNISPHRVCVTHMAPNTVYSPASLAEKKKWQSEIIQKFGIDGRYILGIGYEPRKNIPLLIEAFSRIAPGYPDIDLVIVAAQEERRLFFQALANELKMTNRVITLPSLPPSDLAILYNLAEAFVFPSDRESFGLPPLEALACGTPTIAMNMTSLPEILEDGAILIDGKDVHVWANAIEKIITDEKLRLQLINRGLQQAVKMTWQRCAQETVKVYQAVAEERQIDTNIGTEFISHEYS